MGDLQFQPPPPWLIQEYVNRKQPAEIANEGIGNALQMYLQQKQQGVTNELAQDTRDIELAKNRAVGGEDFNKNLASIQSERNAPQSPGDIGENPVHAWFRKTLGGGGPVGKSPDMSQPPTPSTGTVSGVDPYAFVPGMTPPTVPDGSNVGDGIVGPNGEINQQAKDEYTRQHGTGGWDKYMDTLGKQNTFQNSALSRESNQPVSAQEYAALQSGNADDIAKAFPKGIPRVLAGSALSAQSRNVRVTHDPYGNPIRVPVAGGPGTAIEYPKNNLNPLQQKLNPNEYKEFTSEVNDFDKDKTVSDNRVMLNNMANVESMLAGYNPALTGPIASRQARAIAGEVGALTDSDIARQTLDPSLLGRLKKAVSVATTGKLPKDQLDLLRQSIATIKKGAQSRVRSVANERATRLSGKFGGKVSTDELIQSMNLPSNYPSGQNYDVQPSTQAYSDTEKEARYQAWKAKQ